MSLRTWRLLAPAFLLALLAGASVAPTSGYIEQSRVRVIVTKAPNTVRCDRDATIEVQVVTREGKRPVANQVVRWRLDRERSSRDGISARSTVTNKRGKTSIRLSFGPTAGRRTVRATATNASNTVSVRCQGGLPETAIVPPADFVEPVDSILVPPATSLDPTRAAEGLPASALRLERLGIDLPIIEGDGVTVPEGSVSHFPDTAWPGQGSNAYFYAHAREGDFLELWQVRTGDVVEIDLADGRTAGYRVSEILPVVAFDAFEHLEPTASERLTLQTSLWYDEAAPRFIVIAEPIPGA